MITAFDTYWTLITALLSAPRRLPLACVPTQNERKRKKEVWLGIVPDNAWRLLWLLLDVSWLFTKHLWWNQLWCQFLFFLVCPSREKTKLFQRKMILNCASTKFWWSLTFGMKESVKKRPHLPPTPQHPAQPRPVSCLPVFNMCCFSTCPPEGAVRGKTSAPSSLWEYWGYCDLSRPSNVCPS